MSDQILQVVNQHYTFTDASLKRSVCLLAFCRHFALQLQSAYLNLGDFAELTYYFVLLAVHPMQSSQSPAGCEIFMAREEKKNPNQEKCSTITIQP